MVLPFGYSPPILSMVLHFGYVHLFWVWSGMVRYGPPILGMVLPFEYDTPIWVRFLNLDMFIFIQVHTASIMMSTLVYE